MPGEERDEEPDPRRRRTGRRGGSPTRCARATTYIAPSAGSSAKNAATTRRPSSVSTFTRASSRCSRPGVAATSSENIALADETRTPRGASSRRTYPSPLADAATRAESDLAPQQPVGREAPGGPGRRDVGGAHHTPAVSRSTSASCGHGRGRRAGAAAGRRPEQREHDADDEDGADDGGRVVAEVRLRAVLEVVARKQRARPEVAVLLRPGRHRVEAVLLQVEVRGTVLAERAAAREQTEREPGRRGRRARSGCRGARPAATSRRHRQCARRPRRARAGG